MSDRRSANAIFVLAFRLKGLLIVEKLRTLVFVVRRKVSESLLCFQQPPSPPSVATHEKLNLTTKTLIMQPIFVNPAQEDQELQKSHPLENSMSSQTYRFAYPIVDIAQPHCNIQSHQSS